MFRTTALPAVAASAALLFALTGCSGSGASTGSAPVAEAAASEASADAAPAEAAPAEPAAPGLNTPVAVGAFEFTATGVAAIGTTVGQAPLSQNAAGTYLQVDLNVKNIGTETQTFLINYVKLVDTEGKTYDADTTAAIYADSTTVWITGINPGLSASGPVIFDVPEGTQAASLLVADGLFSDGATILLK